MAHSIKVVTVPHLNKDGSIGKSNMKDYFVYDRTRRGTILMGKVTTQKSRDILIEKIREDIINDHLTKHPNDMAFRHKHGLA